LDIGLRRIDTAQYYKNEDVIGDALQKIFQEGKLKREDIFITTKLANNNHRPEYVRKAIETSLQKLKLDYVDLYLMHWPLAFKPGDDMIPKDESGKAILDSEVTLKDTWKAMEGLLKEGKCKAIGVSNFTINHLEEILKSAEKKPAVNQVEAHPYLPQWEMLEFCKKHNIVMEAYSPLGHKTEGSKENLVEDPMIQKVSNKLNKTPSQVLLAWSIQRGVPTIPKSTSSQHLKEDFDLSKLPDSAMEDINGIKTRARYIQAKKTFGVPVFEDELREE